MAYGDSDAPKARPKKVEDVRRCFKFAASAEQKQREREVEDLKFHALEHWPAEISAMRKGQPASQGMPPLPPRPCLVVDTLGQAVRQVTNQARNSQWGVDVSPRGTTAGQDSAELMQGAIRQMEYDPSAKTARLAAFDRAVIAGRGYYRLLLEYANDADDDLDVVVKRILNQANVYFDPTSEEPDKSDAMWAIICTTLTEEAYKREFPDSDYAKAESLDEFYSTGDNADGWITDGPDGQKAIRIAEYFSVEETVRDIRLLLADGSSMNKAEYDALPKAQRQPVINKRPIKDRKVHWCKVNGREVLDEQDWPGRYIPIIPIVGEELIVPDSDDLRRYQGIIRPARDPQFGLDVMFSDEITNIGLSTKSPYIAYTETIEGFESWWQQSATRAFPYLPIKAARGPDGSVLPAPQRNVAEPPIQAQTQAVMQFKDFVKSATGIFDPSLGNIAPSERSGRAIMALQKQAEVGVSNYLSNYGSALKWEGIVECDLICKVYTRPGRILWIRTENEESEPVMVNQPFVTGPDGMPQPVPEGTEGARFYPLSPEMQFQVSVKVGKAFDTAREEAAQTIGEIIAGNPQLLQVVGDIYFGTQDFAGARQLAERFKKLLPPNLQDEQNGQPSPEQLQQQMQQMQQMIQLLSKELEAKTQIIETDQVKAQQQAQIAEVKTQADVASESLKQQAETERLTAELAVKVHLERMKVVADLLKTRATLEQRQTEAMIDQATNELNQEVALAGQREEREAVSMEAERQRQHESTESERDRQSAVLKPN